MTLEQYEQAIVNELLTCHNSLKLARHFGDVVRPQPLLQRHFGTVIMLLNDTLKTSLLISLGRLYDDDPQCFTLLGFLAQIEKLGPGAMLGSQSRPSAAVQERRRAFLQRVPGWRTEIRGFQARYRAVRGQVAHRPKVRPQATVPVTWDEFSRHLELAEQILNGFLAAFRDSYHAIEMLLVQQELEGFFRIENLAEYDKREKDARDREMRSFGIDPEDLGLD